MRFGILGPLAVVGEDGARRDPAARQQRRLLLALLVLRGEPVSTDRLVDMLWSQDDLPRDPVGTVRTYVTRLRTALEPDRVGGAPRLLAGGPDHYTLHLDGHELDAVLFEEDLARGITTLDEPDVARGRLEQALGRWRGPALLEVADEHWATPEAVRLEELRLTGIEQRLRCLIDIGRHDEAIGVLEEHVRLHRLRERPHGLLMVALDRCGRAADAAAVFRTFRDRLVDEVGIEPSPDLRRLHEALLTSSRATTFSGTAIGGVWNELPAARDSLRGRERELAIVTSLLEAHQVVTLAGAGGVGKTRVAVEIARATADAGGRVLFVDLGRVGDDDVVDAIFAALRLPSVARGGGVDRLVRLLGDEPALMVVDNCEHVLDEVADLVHDLTGDCPDLNVLATGREPLGLSGEHVHRLPSLGIEASVALFQDRATAVGVGPSFGPDELHHIEDICRRLDGIPLAIEFAAARAAHLPVAEIAGHLDERFWLLTGNQRSLPRHRTLQAAIDWSYELLDGDEQAVLRAASVFVDGFDADALAAVTGHDERETIDTLASLVRRSLVETATGVRRARYRLLETVRLYGLDRLAETGDTNALRQAHADHFLARACTEGPEIPDLPEAVQGSMCRLRLDPVSDDDEHDLANHVAALDWFDRRGDPTSLGRLAARLATVLGYRSFLDPDRRYLGRTEIAGALSDPAERAAYLTASALNASYLGAMADVLPFARAALDAATDPGTRAAAAALAALASTGFEPDRVAGLVDRALREAPSAAESSRLLLRGQRALSLVMQGRLAEAVDELAPHARAGDVFATSEVIIVLHVLGEDDRASGWTIPAGAPPDAVALWAYRWTLVGALTAAAHGRHVQAARSLLDAARQVASVPVDHLDHDILLGCAGLAYHAGDPARCEQVIATVGRELRSPGSFVLASHYRRLAQQHTEAGQREPIREVAADLDPRGLLRGELQRLRTVVETHSRSHGPAATRSCRPVPRARGGR